MGGTNGGGEDFAAVPPLCIRASDPAIVRLIDEPGRPVWLNTDAIDSGGRRPPGLADSPPTLGVRAGGLRIESTIRGSLHAWVRLSDGQWRAVVTAALSSANQRTAVRLTFWCPPESVTPRPE